MCQNYHTFSAGADLAAGTIVRLDSGEVLAATNASHVPLGVTMEACADGEKVTVAMCGSTGIPVLASGTIAEGAFVVATTGGKAAALSAITTSTWVLGQCHTSGAASGVTYCAISPWFNNYTAPAAG